MTKYVALLRGIAPSGKNMQNDKLRSVFEKLGFEHVQSVIASGNILFESPRTDTATMEAEVEAAFPKLLGFNSTTIIRSRRELEELIAKDPFDGAEHTQKIYLTVTFLKGEPRKALDYPYRPEGKPYEFLACINRAICARTPLESGAKTPDTMAWLEREFGKDITTRTLKTVERILQKMS